MKLDKMTNVLKQFGEFFTTICYWSYDTMDVTATLILDYLTRALELVIAIMKLFFQLVCFLRDLLVEAMQTFANVFQGIVNIISAINCEDVEDFTSACIVILIWFGSFKIIYTIASKNSESGTFDAIREYFKSFINSSDNNNKIKNGTHKNESKAVSKDDRKSLRRNRDPKTSKRRSCPVRRREIVYSDDDG